MSGSALLIECPHCRRMSKVDSEYQPRDTTKPLFDFDPPMDGAVNEWIREALKPRIPAPNEHARVVGFHIRDDDDAEGGGQ